MKNFYFFKSGLLLIIFLLFGIRSVLGQTYPEVTILPVNQNFGTTSFNSYPTGFGGWIATNINTATPGNPTANESIISVNGIQLEKGIFGYALGGNGNASVYLQTTNPANQTNGMQLVLGINTTGLTNVQLSYKLYFGKFNPADPNQHSAGLVCQYKIGKAGNNWVTINTNDNPSIYHSTGDTIIVTATLPSDVEDQSEVYIRWATLKPGIGTSNFVSIFIDDIMVQGYAIVCNDNIEITLPTGECQITPEILGLTPPKIMLSDGSEYVAANVTSNAPAIFTRGVYRIKWIASDEWGGFIDTCIQIVVVNYPVCGSNDITWILDGPRIETVTEVQNSLYAIDTENNQYATVRLGCDCWLKKNLMTTLYADGTPIEGIYKYYDANMYPDSSENSNVFGLLYNWEAAVNACPTGWKLPTALQFSSLSRYHVDDLRSVEYWLNSGTNLTGFSALPAGMFNNLSNSFHYLMGDAYFWSTSAETTQQGSACHLSYACPTPQIVAVNNDAGLSVRCVKE